MAGNTAEMEKSFFKHLESQAQFNRETSVMLERIHNISTQNLEEAKKTNGRVTKLEETMNVVKPQVDHIVEREKERIELKKKMSWFWIERAFWAGLLIIGMILGIKDLIF